MDDRIVDNSIRTKLDSMGRYLITNTTIEQEEDKPMNLRPEEISSVNQRTDQTIFNKA